MAFWVLSLNKKKKKIINKLQFPFGDCNSAMTLKDLYNIISKVCGIETEEITNNSDFTEDFNAEPTEMQELREIIEDTISEKFEDEDFEEVSTVDDLIRLIEEYSNEFIG